MNPFMYKQFYRSLNEIRDLFHKQGRLNDSNSKLDEIVKLIAIYLFELNNHGARNPIRRLIAAYEVDHSVDIVHQLQETFSNLTSDRTFLNAEGISIFGNNPTINIQDNDGEFAYRLLTLIINPIDKIITQNPSRPQFDLLNEVFGHFVRDNFRNNIEDAQYMTPAEVVEFMVSVAIEDIVSNGDLGKQIFVMDPFCGVGSFLSAFYRAVHQKSEFNSVNVKIIGQDKVERMVRLSKINMMLFGTANHEISSGNSLIGKSFISDYRSKVDIILTNPPFGARFSGKDIATQGREIYPLLNQIAYSSNGQHFLSEIIFIDRCLSLLRPGGLLLAVVPDSIISSKTSLSTHLRNSIGTTADLKMIVQLPEVTFAQAGTRTKTHILVLRKKSTQNETKSRYIFFGHSKNLGFKVKSRKGVPIKEIDGENDLAPMLDLYLANRYTIDEQVEYGIVSEDPSSVFVRSDSVVSNQWTPSHYNARRFKALSQLTNPNNSEIELIELSKLAEFVTKKRRNEFRDESSRCISVLHVNDIGVINYGDLLTYEPKYPGIPCLSDDLLFSKINPRIPRAVIVPELEFPLTCSTEFEIMTTKSHVSNFAIMLLLLSPLVREQILHLTSGTSSSHNRIKTEQLRNVVLPIPKRSTSSFEEFHRIVLDFSEAVRLANDSRLRMIEIQTKLDNLLHT